MVEQYCRFPDMSLAGRRDRIGDGDAADIEGKRRIPG